MQAVDLRAAIGHAQAGRWHEAHAIVQRDEADPQAAWIHAVFHRIEGDLANARYWYGIAGVAVGAGDPQAELARIEACLS